MIRRGSFGYMLLLVLLTALSGPVVDSVTAGYPTVDSVTFAATDRGDPATGQEVSALGRRVQMDAADRVRNRAADGEPIIVDHTCTDITAVPQEWIEEAKETLHIGYGHTSHGSQLTTGMSGLVAFANGGGLGLALPQDIFQFSPTGNHGGEYLHLFEGDGYGWGDLDHDCGYYPGWVNETRTYLGTPDPDTGRGTNHPEINAIIWSWCGQVSDRTEETMLNTYLLPMTQLEEEYPGVTFVYMTGHAEGTGEEGNVHLRNQQIREYCIQNGKVLYDFYDIELYDPDGNYYGDKMVEDDCDYDSDGNGVRDSNWAEEWQASHTQGLDWYDCQCAHSKPLNCNQKAYAAWWLWARVAGWDGTAQAEPEIQTEKTASANTVSQGQIVTYTVVVRNIGTPLAATVYVTDELPSGLSYVPGSLAATVGAVSDDDAPVLRWSGVLSPTPAVTVTYAAVVSATGPETIINTATIAPTGYPNIERTATVNVTASPDPLDLSPSDKTASPQRVQQGDRVTYTVTVRNDTEPLPQTVLLTDTIPAGLTYAPGTLTATRGSVNDAGAPTLTWTGPLTPTPAVTITYATTVSAAEPRVIANRAVIAAPGEQVVTRTVTVQANWLSIYLPVVLRQ